MRWDRTMMKIVKEISQEQGIPEEEVKKAIHFTMQCVHKAMEDDEMPKVLLRGLGTMRLIPRRLERKINGTPLKDPEAEEKRLQNVKRLTRVLNRITKEDEKIRRAKGRK